MVSVGVGAERKDCRNCPVKLVCSQDSGVSTERHGVTIAMVFDGSVPAGGRGEVMCRPGRRPVICGRPNIDHLSY